MSVIVVIVVIGNGNFLANDSQDVSDVFSENLNVVDIRVVPILSNHVDEMQ